jgi:hypothetical protein
MTLFRRVIRWWTIRHQDRLYRDHHPWLSGVRLWTQK